MPEWMETDTSYVCARSRCEDVVKSWRDHTKHTRTYRVNAYACRALVATKQLMVPKRRFWKHLRKIKCGFSIDFSMVLSPNSSSHTIARDLERVHFIFCKKFQTLRLGTMNCWPLTRSTPFNTTWCESVRRPLTRLGATPLNTVGSHEIVVRFRHSHHQWSCHWSII